MPFYMYLLLLLQILGLATGQLITKIGVSRAGEISLSNLSHIIGNPWLWLGLLIYGAASALWMWLLSKGEFEVLVPFQSLSMIATVIGAYFLFHDPISPTRWVGIVIMVIGAFLVAK